MRSFVKRLFRLWREAGDLAATRQALAEASPTPLGDGFVRGGQVVPRDVPGPPIYNLHSDETVDATTNGKFGKRTTSVSFVVVHWAGAGFDSAIGLGRYFSRTGRSVSSHIGVDLSGAYQYLDLDVRAWHAGRANTHSVGIDIMQEPKADALLPMRELGYSVEVIDNPTDRGDRRCLSLDDRVCGYTAATVLEVLSIYGLLPSFPPTQDVYSVEEVLEAGWTVVGHHHVSSRKWDVAPWFEQLREEVWLREGVTR